jgi:DNA helicase-2/ATP-dependent DNA helicase PcrA
MKYFWSHFTDKEFKELSEYGADILKKYYAEYISKESHDAQYFLEEKVDNAEWNGVPIKGVLDRVEVYKDYVNVTDYKTGNGFKPDTKKKLKPPTANDVLGGDYWRQIVFYKILLDSNKTHNWNMISGEMDFVEPKRNTEEFFREKIVVQPVHIEIVGEQITETWSNIQDHKFDNLCDNEKCYWCNFVREDYVFSGEYEIDLLEESQNF